MKKKPGPDFMALLTVSKELEARTSALTSSIIHELVGNVGWCTCKLPAKAFYAYRANAEIRHLPSKRRMVIVSAEFGG